ncbi:hypothetical protein CR513_25636, partial [Mucuna pruriens]
MDRAKEKIVENFQKQESRYKKVWKIIDTRWNLQLHRPLHAAAYYLNLRMIPNKRTRFAMDQQLEKFKGAKGLFGMNMAIDTRDKKQPTLWWESYGGQGPRNLNVKVDKGKSTIGDEDEIEDIEEGGEVILDDEDELSDPQSEETLHIAEPQNSNNNVLDNPITNCSALVAYVALVAEVDVAKLNFWENAAPAPVAAADVLEADMTVEIG